MERVQALRDNIDELLSLSKPLKNQEVRPTSILILLVAAYRRSHDTLLAISKLSDDKSLSSSMFILVRTLLEDVVNVEYMLAGDKDEEAGKFAAFINIQKYDDVSFLKEVDGLDADLEVYVKQVETEYEKYKPYFLDRRGRVFKSWNNKLAGQMIRELKTAKQAFISQEVLKWYARVYLDGNRKAHFNPSDILPYLYTESLNRQNDDHLREGLESALHLFSTLTIRYVDELEMTTGISSYRKLATRAKELGWG
jgi:hypothetical protein